MERGRIEYDKLRLSALETLLSALAGGAVGGAVMAVFFRNLFPILFLAGLGTAAGPYLLRRQRIEKRRTQLILEFKEALYDLTVGLRAGKSLEGSFIAAYEDMDEHLMPLIWQEWGLIVSQIRLGFPIEESLMDLSRRSGIEEIRSFGRSVQICKRSEGDIAKVMDHTIRLLTDRMEIRAEVRLLLAQKRMEQRIMTVMPFGIVVLILVLSPDYLAPLYTSVRGYLIMAVCLVISLLSLLISRRIARIDL